MVGKSLSHYEILEPLGAGGKGEVYLAEDIRLGRKVAIKVLPAEFASDPERLARFEQEARAAAALNHAHIAAVFDVGSEGDTHFMVQEYLAGQSLRERLDAGALPLKKALDLAIEVGEALIAAHKARIIHRRMGAIWKHRARPDGSRRTFAPAVLSWLRCPLILLTAGSLLAASACTDRNPPQPTRAEVVAGTEPTSLKVLLIGIDGATFRVLDPLLDVGRAPHFASLIERGARASLRSQDPLISPAIWTTIATGRDREDHRIRHFQVFEDGRRTQRLVSSSERQTTALWNQVGMFGKSVGIVGWWASWPAEPVDGWIISDRMTRGLWTTWLQAERGDRLTFPGRLAPDVAPLLIDPMEPPLDEIRDLAEFTDEELAELEAAEEPIIGHWLSILKFTYSAQRSVENMALHLLARGQPDLTALYLIANDPISHSFWHFYEPEAFPEGSVDPQDAARLGRAVPGIVRHNDAFIGKVLELIDPDTVVFVVSDHGFGAALNPPERRSGAEFAEHFADEYRQALARGEVTVGQPGTHRDDGLFLAAGGPVREGVQTRATIFDVAPTILALMGLPVSDEMPGRVLTELVDPGFWQEHPVTHVDSYERLLPRTEVPEPGSVDDQEALRMLRALGYIR